MENLHQVLIKKKGKTIDNKYIETNEKDKISISSKHEDNYWYKRFRLFVNAFIYMTNSITKTKDYVILLPYYQFHFTIIDSNEITKNDNKKNIKL